MGIDKVTITGEDTKQQKWHNNPILTAVVSAILTGILSLTFFIFSRTVDNGNNISGDGAKISALQDKIDTMQVQVSTLQQTLASGYVSQQTFTEFKNRYENDQAKLLANDTRMESKLDTLLMEHAKTPKQQASSSNTVASVGGR